MYATGSLPQRVRPCAGPGLILPEVSREWMAKRARTGWPLEVCGLLLGHRSDWHGSSGAVEGWRFDVHRAVACRNRHPHPEWEYDVHPRDFLRWDRAGARAGMDVIGVWHSHPHGDATASQTDAERAWGGWVYVIVGVDGTGALDWQAWIRTGPEKLARVPIQSPR